MAQDKIELEVVTPASAVLDIKVDEVVLPGIEGELGILPGHLPLLTALDVGPMVVKQDGKTRKFYLDGGFAEVMRTRVTVLTEECEGVEDIDVEHARQLVEEAQESIALLTEKSKSEPVEQDVMNQHQEQLKRAQTQVLLGEGQQGKQGPV